MTPESLHLTKPYRKLVAIRSTHNLFMLEKALSETDPDTTDLIVMTAKSSPSGEASMDAGPARRLRSSADDRGGGSGGGVRQAGPSAHRADEQSGLCPLADGPDLACRNCVIGASNMFTADEQLDQISLLWINLHGGDAAPLTVRIFSKDRDLYFDLGGGNRIPGRGNQGPSVAECAKRASAPIASCWCSDDSRVGLDVFDRS